MLMKHTLWLPQFNRKNASMFFNLLYSSLIIFLIFSLSTSTYLKFILIAISYFLYTYYYVEIYLNNILFLHVFQFMYNLD